MATPHVTGAVALLARKAGGDIARIRQALQDTAVPRPSQACGEDAPVPNYAYGRGILDVAAAWLRLPDTPPPPPPPPPPPENQPPWLVIDSPVNMSRYQCGEGVPLKGRAGDPEDGDLSGQIVWRDLYYGWRGATGEMLGVTGADCDLGWHWISAEVTDRGGMKTELTVMVEVIPKGVTK
jgi:hypothetical protein